MTSGTTSAADRRGVTARRATLPQGQSAWGAQSRTSTGDQHVRCRVAVRTPPLQNKARRQFQAEELRDPWGKPRCICPIHSGAILKSVFASTGYGARAASTRPTWRPWSWL